MNKREIIESWKEEILPIIREHYEADGIPDRPARRCSFCDYVDVLARDGYITEEVADEVYLPDEYETI